jgi:hypothetical protein
MNHGDVSDGMHVCSKSSRKRIIHQFKPLQAYLEQSTFTMLGIFEQFFASPMGVNHLGIPRFPLLSSGLEKYYSDPVLTLVRRVFPQRDVFYGKMFDSMRD